jgi:thymidylate synthase
MVGEEGYLKLLDDILFKGEGKKDRTGTGTLSLFGRQLIFDNIYDNFPLLTTKFVSFNLIASELLWFLQGGRPHRQLNIHDLKKIYPSNNIWNEWSKDNGDLGPIYGVQWRHWGINDIDQIKNVVNNIINNPDDRRHIVTAWNPDDISDMQLPPCHILFQFYVSDTDYLDCQIYQRSCDMFLGVPFNIASYALLTFIIAELTGKIPGNLSWIGGDCHIYTNHVDQVNIQLSRNPKPFPRLIIYNERNLEDFNMDSFVLEDYTPYPHIPAPISV